MILHHCVWTSKRKLLTNSINTSFAQFQILAEKSQTNPGNTIPIITLWEPRACGPGPATPLLGTLCGFVWSICGPVRVLQISGRNPFQNDYEIRTIFYVICNIFVYLLISFYIFLGCWVKIIKNNWINWLNYFKYLN